MDPRTSRCTDEGIMELVFHSIEYDNCGWCICGELKVTTRLHKVLSFPLCVGQQVHGKSLYLETAVRNIKLLLCL